MTRIFFKVLYILTLAILLCVPAKSIIFHDYSHINNIYATANYSYDYRPLAKALQNPTSLINLMTNLDPTTIPAGKCRNETAYWLSSLIGFVNAIQINCTVNDTQCHEIQSKLLAEDLFAAKQLDAFGKIPAGLLDLNVLWMGSWEECVDIEAPADPSYATQFCYVNLGTSLISDALSSDGLVDEEVASFFEPSANYTHEILGACGANCLLSSGPKKNAAFYIVCIYCALGAFLLITCGLIDYITDCERWQELRTKTWMQCILAFSLYTNGAEILDQTKRPGQIQCLDCIRTISMTWVICGHVMANFINGDNPLAMMRSTNNFLDDALTNAFFSVDSFFFIGGVLIAYIFYREMDKNPKKIRSPIYWALYYVHRYLRLSPPYFLFIGVTAAIQEHLTVGPMDLNFMFTSKPCTETWWRNVLYINNLFDLQNECMGHTWYLAVDWQIHVFSPLLIVPLFFSRIGGIIVAIVLIAISTVANYVTFYKYDFPANMIALFTDAMDANRISLYEQFLYFAPWIRFTPYVFGILTGYFLHKTRDIKFDLHPLIAIALWLASFAIGIGCVFGLFDYIKGPGHNISVFARASYCNWSRIGWSLALAWIVIACQKNWAGPIKNFMELGFWMPFGRLTYCAYLTHFVIADIVLSMKRQPLHYVSHFETYVNNAIPAFVASYAFAFLWSCMFELSFMKLEKMAVSSLLGTGKRGHPQQDTKVTPMNSQILYGREHPFGGHFVRANTANAYMVRTTSNIGGHYLANNVAMANVDGQKDHVNMVHRSRPAINANNDDSLFRF